MRKLIMLFVALFAFVIQPLSLWAAEPVPAQLAETMRTVLVQAQITFTSDASSTQQALALAQSTYAGDFAATLRRADTAADARIRAGLNAAQAAIQRVASGASRCQPRFQVATVTSAAEAAPAASPRVRLRAREWRCCRCMAAILPPAHRLHRARSPTVPAPTPAARARPGHRRTSAPRTRPAPGPSTPRP